MGVIGLSQVHKAHYISALLEESRDKKALIICHDEGTASRLCDDLNSLCGGAVLYPARDFSFRGSDNKSHEFEQKRLCALSAILDGSCRFILCSIEAATQFTLPPEELIKRSLTLSAGDEITTHKLVRILLSAGYSRTDLVEGVGQFSLRGGILDFYPPDSTEPCRIEFWGDEIDSMAHFDIESQRRTDVLQKVRLTPCTEVLFDSHEAMKEKLLSFVETVKGKGSVKAKEKIREDIDALEHFTGVGAPDKYLSLAYESTATVFDYMKDGLLFVCESASVKQRFNTASALLSEDIRTLFEEGLLTKGIDTFTLSWPEVLKKYEEQGAVYVDSLARGSFDTPVKELVSINARQTSRWDGTLSYLIDDLKPCIHSGYTCVVMAGTEKSAKELAYDLETEGIRARYFPVVPSEFPKGYVSVTAGTLSSGFEYDFLRFSLFTYGRAVSTEKRTKKAKYKTGKGLTSLDEISKGDYLVHAIHGIGVLTE